MMCLGPFSRIASRKFGELDCLPHNLTIEDVCLWEEWLRLREWLLSPNCLNECFILWSFGECDESDGVGALVGGPWPSLRHVVFSESSWVSFWRSPCLCPYLGCPLDQRELHFCKPQEPLCWIGCGLAWRTSSTAHAFDFEVTSSISSRNKEIVITSSDILSIVSCLCLQLEKKGWTNPRLCGCLNYEILRERWLSQNDFLEKPTKWFS